MFTEHLLCTGSTVGGQGWARAGGRLHKTARSWALLLNISFLVPHWQPFCFLSQLPTCSLLPSRTWMNWNCHLHLHQASGRKSLAGSPLHTWRKVPDQIHHQGSPHSSTPEALCAYCSAPNPPIFQSLAGKRAAGLVLLLTELGKGPEDPEGTSGPTTAAFSGCSAH